MKSQAAADLFGSLPSHVAQQPSHLPTFAREPSHSRSDFPRPPESELTRDRHHLVVPVEQTTLNTPAALARLERIQTILDHAHGGSDRRIRHPFLSTSIFTGGFHDLCEAASCHWFADLIASYQSPPFIQAHPFQLWTLRRIDHSDYKAVATLQEDTSQIPIIEQFIPYTDFPLAEFACYTCHDTTTGNHLAVTMLKEEY